MRFDFVSPKFCQIYGRAEEDFLRDPSLAFSVTHPEDSESLIEDNQHATETGECFHWEGRYVINKKIVWVEISSEPSLLPNGDTLWSGIIKDITERKQAETNLVAAKLLAEQANQAKSKFLSSMSHELRTPLNAILGFSQLIEMKSQEEKTRDNSQEIINAGNHLLSLIEEILDLSKIESGHIELSIEECSLNKILNNTLTLINPLAEKHSIQIENKVNTSFNINVDKMRFKQVILNFLSNAIKYNSENGKVIIDSSTDNNMLRLSITDTGKGLTPEQLNNLFEPFERLGAENSNIEGTGLGLNISKDLIELMGGTITVESTVGKGSRFSICVPLS